MNGGTKKNPTKKTTKQNKPEPNNNNNKKKKKTQNKGKKNHNSNCPLTISKSFHRRTTNDRVSLTVCLFFLGNVFWILAKILCLYNTMLCGMAKCYQHSAPPNTGKDEKESQQKEKKNNKPRFPSPHNPPPKKQKKNCLCNDSNEPQNGDGMRGPWGEFGGSGDGFWDAPGWVSQGNPQQL